MKNQRPDGAIQQLASTLRKRFGTHLVKIILFGSRARGDYEPDSDYDVLVLLDEVTKEIRDEIDEIVWQIGWDNDVLITSIVHDVRTFETPFMNPFSLTSGKKG